MREFQQVAIGALEDSRPGSFKIGPFGSSLKKSELTTKGIPVVGIENVLAKDFNPPFRRFITEEKYRELQQYSVSPGDVLVTTMGTIGRAAVVPNQVGRMVIDSHLFRMRVDKSQVLPAYLCYALNNYEGIRQQLDQKSRGAIMEGLNTSILKECTMPLPPLPEQHRIAAILDKADRLRRLRCYSLQLSDTYLQSLFLQMFGDPASNPMGWPVEQLGSSITYLTSGSRGWAEYYSQKGPLFLRIQNIGKNRLLLDDLAYVQPPDNAEGQRTIVKPGDLLISITADLGRTAVIPDGFPIAYINQHLALLRLDARLNSVFVAGMLTTPGGKAQITKLDREGVKSGLNFDDIRGLQVIVPPLPLQESFAQLTKKQERLRAQQREAARQTDHLFQTLLHQAFIGQLSSQPVSSIHSDLSQSKLSLLTNAALPTVEAPLSSIPRQARLPFD